jgi:hypothetical protein
MRRRSRAGITLLQWSLTLVIVGGVFVGLHQIGRGEWKWLEIPMQRIGVALLVLGTAGLLVTAFRRIASARRSSAD